ncbi:MAG: 5'/3'-nucleotidase SurE [Chloroflexi bacterium]|nr:5'/3'-nucleotidase SurE [Chloroflexota bacterium]
MISDSKLILLTNDDGIRSPGLWAAAHALEPLGFVVVAAPREQSSGAGRSLPAQSEGRIHEEQAQINGESWTVHAIDGTPAQAVQHALLELVPRKPDLVVSGINYGENVGSGVTISGTVGATLEAASFGVPALAVSLETDKIYHRSYSDEVDFATAAHFTRYFAKRLLALSLPRDVDVLKVEVPSDATSATPWRMTRLSRQRYYEPQKPEREKFSDRGPIDYNREIDHAGLEPDSDVQALISRVVSVTPLSLDLTSRVDFGEMTRLLQNGK